MPIRVGNRSIEVIDAHVHTFPDTVAPVAVGKLQKISGLTPYTNGTVDDTLTKMDALQIDCAVLLNIATAPKQQATINNCAAGLSVQYENRFIPFGSVHFNAPDAVREVERIHALGIKGIKLHPDYQGFFIDDEQLFPVYEACEAIGLPITFHTGWDCYSPHLIHATPEASRRVLRRFPRLKMILAHFGGLKMWDDVERWLIGENVWFDTAMCATYADKEQIERMIHSHAPEKVLLGSDCPWENPARSIALVLSLDISDSQKEMILSGNIKALLNLAM